MTADNRCIGCGRPIEPGERTFRILVGEMLDGGEFDEQEEYGDLHEGCFHRAVESPKTVLEQLRRAARSNRRKELRKTG